MAAMQPLFIRLANLVWLVLILMGVPAITGRSFGWLRLSDSSISQPLTLWGLAVGAVLNILGAIFLAKGGKAKRLCWQWCAAFALLVVIEYLVIRHYINFDWLKTFLLWVKAKVSGGSR